MRTMFACPTIVVLLIMCVSGAYAQDAPEEPQGYLLTTVPAGATAFLNGEYELIINTPARLPSNLSGNYNTRITRNGYEQWKGELSFVPGTSNSVKIQLKKKTALKAGMRSLLLPGWGQIYSGNKFRGSLFTLGTIISAGGLYLADKKYQDKRADYDIAAQAYSDARSIDEQIRLKTIKDSKQREAYNAETDRRTVFFIGVGLWAYNVLDAIIFFPGGDGYYPQVSAMDDGARLSFLISF